jgi:hypothetical protein
MIKIDFSFKQIQNIVEYLQGETDFEDVVARDLALVVVTSRSGQVEYLDPDSGKLYLISWDFNKNINVKVVDYASFSEAS